MSDNQGETLRQAVFGANDGLVSTFGLVAGLIGANAPQAVLIVANVVNMVAAGMSMGLGSYLATKSQVEYNQRLVTEERARIRSNSRAAKRELTKLLRAKGLSASASRTRANAISKNEQDWVDFVCAEKDGLARASFPNPITGGIIMFFVFVACGLVPIIPLLIWRGTEALAMSALLTALALFAVGAMKQKLTGKSAWQLGTENLMIGAITGVVGFLAGMYTSSLMGSAFMS